MKLTKDTDKLLCFIYYCYLDRVENGQSKHESSHFSPDVFNTIDQLERWHPSDISICLNELKHNNLIQLYTANAFVLLHPGKIYMETRFTNGIKDLLSYVSLFK